MDIIDSFNERCMDVEIYTQAIAFIDAIATNRKEKLKCLSYDDREIEYQPNRELQKILRANFYLILYNLVEATTNAIICHLQDTINDEGVNLVNLSPQIQSLYIGKWQRDLTTKQGNGCKTRIAQDLVAHVHNKEILYIKELEINISGNVDYDFIMNGIISKIGIPCPIMGDIKNIKKTLGRAKEFRNKLAHGDVAFSKLGAVSITSADINNDYLLCKQFLLEVLTNYEQYIKNKSYLHSKSEE